MTRGRKPLPRETLALRDTLRKDRDRPSSVLARPINPDEVGSLCQVPGLQSATRRARDIYWTTCKKVAAQGILEPAFCPQILFYAIEYDIVLQCEADIKEQGMYLILEGKKGTFVVQNPSVKQLHAAVEKVLKIGSNFGFSPVDVQRIKMSMQSDKQEKGIKALFAAMAVVDDSEDVDEQ